MWIWTRLPYWTQVAAVVAFGLCGLAVIGLQWGHQVPEVMLGVSMALAAIACLVGTNALRRVVVQPLWMQALSSCAVGGGAATMLAVVLIAASAVIATALVIGLVIAVIGALFAALGD